MNIDRYYWLAFDLNRRCGLDLNRFALAWTTRDLVGYAEYGLIDWLRVQCGSHPEFSQVLSDNGFEESR